MTNQAINQDSFTNKKIDYLQVTEKAQAEIIRRVSYKSSDSECFGIKIGIKTRGCSGLSYNIEYASPSNVTEFDEMLDNKEINIFIDPKISLFIFNTIMDFEEKTTDNGTVIESGFVFKNPNEKGRCGCGESFYV